MKRADGGYTPDNPQISREDDAEILSHGRPQSTQTDINLTPPPPFASPLGPIATQRDANWMPQPIPTDIGKPVGKQGPHRVHLGFGGVAHRDAGGSAPQTLPVETATTQAPMEQQQQTYYQNMTPEQLQEEALKLKGSPQGQLAQRVLQQKRTQPNAVPVVPDQQAGLPQQYAMGGGLDETKGGAHLAERGISGGGTPASPSGLLHTSGPGRSDNLQIHPHADSYVLPADVVSGMGQGNSLAGAKALEGALGGHQGPGGIPMPLATKGQHIGQRMSAPKPPGMGGFGSGMPGGMAAGGAKEEPQTVPIIAAGGEYVVSPDQVKAIGHGNIKRGHKILDAFVLHVRKRTIGEMKKLKGPVKS